jgi:hypothetical protein
MRKIIFVLFLALFLVACGPKDMPNSPGTPGAATMAGKAGIFLPSASMPSWTRPPSRDFSIELSNANVGAVQTITYGNPLATKEYATWWKVYYYLDGNWHSIKTDIDEDKIRKNKGWIVNKKSTWTLPITEQFKSLTSEQKTVYVVLYTCTRTGKQWDCGDGPGRKGEWQMDLFKVGMGVEQPAKLPYEAPEEIVSPDFNNQESRSQSITAYATGDVESSSKQYAILIIAALAILIITGVNFIEF